ncbi:Acetoin:2,6-dichlorophenolindophenol oxidoreductase subunit beta [Pontiella desulfatans]|uniref:Acetoin:2,6-dichlorophenolindophenol oxidoreductase subunit beta n=1 Tax=Pontiella desulfatans TaxID=2750659 RepID=A0A6C2TZ61_PONDE|nr:alpha-ketoacid dehydrogenase subunit alpha/beta [Pontiella desulfatans]VGO12942.1 Acetoin:2,6-dichlorophenolindophenol oxidoreductase subunit beta [Pontiella desulfatans]
MPKNQVICPKESRKAGEVTFKPIPVNQYKSDYKKELKKYGKKRLVKMYYDMLMIREFETMLNQIKVQGSYEGMEYNHPGPAHLSIGQEAAAVGQSVHLDTDDYIFGSHRSHGEIMAKCLSAISKLDDDKLNTIMEEFFDGATLNVVKDGSHETVKDLAEDFILYGTLAEIFARETGINKGLGGSMHAFFIPFGSMPNNALVGGSADISVGSAMNKLINRKPGIVIANIGDASMGCGPVYEGIWMAAMDQYVELWDNEFGHPPVMINIMNNQYGMGGQTVGETMSYKFAARIGAGVNPDQMHAERVDGYNPLAVADATERKKKVLLAGKGPVLLDIITYRMSGHSPSDASSYRSKEEMELWEAEDCVRQFGSYLVENGALSEAEAEAMKAKVVGKVCKAMKLSIDESISPYSNPNLIEGVMYSNGKVEKFDDREPELLQKIEDNDRVKKLKRKQRFAFDENGQPYKANQLYTYRDAIFEAMLHRFATDPTMIAYGEENRDWGGAFACYNGLTELLPYHRLFNSPISEGAIVGTACGYALSGGRVCAELMYCDFMGRAGDEIFNQISKWQSMSAGILKMPLVLRVSVGNKYGAQHSQDWTAMVNHIPGLKVYYPATTYDAKGMLNLALAGTDPVIFFESQKTYGVGELFEKGGVPEGYFETEEGEPAVRTQGKDLTLITLGPVLYSGMKVVDEMKEKYGMDVELIDLRFVNPLNYDKLVESVKKTGRVVLASDSVERGSCLHNIAANLTNLCFDYLDAPPVVIGAKNWISPAAEMETDYFPQASWIIDAVHERIVPLPGHVVKHNYTNGELQRIARLGV